MARLGGLSGPLGGILAHLGAVLAYLGGVLGRLGGLLGLYKPQDPQQPAECGPSGGVATAPPKDYPDLLGLIIPVYILKIRKNRKAYEQERIIRKIGRG